MVGWTVFAVVVGVAIGFLNACRIVYNKDKDK